MTHPREPSAPTSGTSTSRRVLRYLDSYSFVLVIQVILIWILTPMVGVGVWVRLPTLVIYSVSIVVTLSVSSAPRWIRNSVGMLCLALVVLEILRYDPRHTPTQVTLSLGFSVLLLLSAGFVLARVITRDTVRSSTISGAVTVFLLMALAFSEIYFAIELLRPGSFSAPGELGYPALQYFSLITISTVGYGDISPVSTAARTLASLEAVAGQIFLVTIVARLVSNLGTSHRDRSDPPGDGDPTH